jgi:SSS family solute:Na+ symporter
MDIFVKKYKPAATNKEIIKIGRWVTVWSAVVSVLIALAINSIKGLNLFDVFQSVLGFLAPPMSVVFLFGVLWKKTTAKAVNAILIYGTIFSIFVGILYLWVFPAATHPAWPNFLLLSFYIFVVLSAVAFLVSYVDKNSNLLLANLFDFKSAALAAKTTTRVWIWWSLLIVVMVALYIIFNGH